MKTTMTAALALSMFAFGAFAAPKQDTSKADSTKSTTVKKSKNHKKSTTAVVAKPAAAVAPVAK